VGLGEKVTDTDPQKTGVALLKSCSQEAGDVLSIKTASLLNALTWRIGITRINFISP
jgi:2,3-bisphosphoglycerate-independent phosphoglycerate mutase